MVDFQHTCYCLPPFDIAAFAGRPPQLRQPVAQTLVHGFLEQAGLSRTRHPGDSDQASQGNFDVDLFEIVFGRPADGDAGYFLVGPQARCDLLAVAVEQGPGH